MALALIHGARKLRHYFQSHPIAVVTTFPLRSILHRPKLLDRLAKWAIELSEFDITYQPRNAIKSQILADFVADFSSKLTLEVEKETIATSRSFSGIWTLYTDGESNESGSGLGLVLKVLSGEIVYQAIKCPKITNNEAEYEAVVAGLKLALEYGAESIKVHCDLQLVVNQVSRENNAEADDLVELALAADPAEPRSRIVIHLLYQIGCEIEVCATGSTHDWRNEIFNYLQQGTLPVDKKEVRKLRVKAARYCLVYGELYRRTFGGPLTKCLGPTDTEPAMKQVHSGYCENHSGERSLARCLLRAGYCWNTMEKDSQNFVRRCIECQTYASAIHQPAEPLHSVITSWPFMKWGLDIIGPFPEAKGKVKFLHVATDYFSKWVEAGAHAKIDKSRAEALVPIEVMEPSIRYSHATDTENMEAMTDELDLLEEHRELADQVNCAETAGGKIYNNKTKLRQIKLGDLVMRMVTPSTKIPNEGKLGANWEGPYRVIAYAGKGAFQLETLDGKIVSNNYNISNLKLFHS
ncbi:uncharacterized protein LOC132624391 [Lycium barbarum]|uniref:uncharacterized protein LOC132624391 n=1 Tax=Lycium barbarum TaxID=112863 RepID=UPI00293EDCE1|nr:uncharacterized protein LOC132624391 [Lycium barbarum]